MIILQTVVFPADAPPATPADGARIYEGGTQKDKTIRVKGYGRAKVIIN